jgi:glycosyltransferase involved in cell wall biosynthesis
MRIAYLGSKGLPSKSGVERVVEGIINHLNGKHDITVYCDAGYTPKGTKIDGIRLVRIATLKGKHTRATSLYFLSALHALFSQYDLIHLHSIDASFILPILRLKYRVVSTSHGTIIRVNREKWGKLARWIIIQMEYPFVYLSNYATSVSKEDANYLETRYKRNINYIPNGVNSSIQSSIDKANDQLSRVGLEPGDYLMFAAGRIDPTKGCHILLEALNRLENPMKTAIVGDLNQIPSYGNHLKEIADQEQVVFLPPISDRELLFGLVRQARIFIFPSISEAMSMMLLEAASLQAPVICSDIPENKAVMQDNALYFRSGDAVDLAKKIQWALQHPDEMLLLGRKAGAYVEEHLTWDKIAAQYEVIYQECLKGKQ